MFALFISLALLGFAAIDPIGIGVMPVLLVQDRPYRRAFVFLSGSFVSLMIMGLLFARGLGEVVLGFEQRNPWFIHSAEVIAGTMLLVAAMVIVVRLRSRKASVGPTERVRAWLKLSSWHLFLLGALLVAAQSAADVVFVVAMVRAGQFQLPGPLLVMAVATYAIAALALQAAVVAAFRLAPAQQRDRILQSVHALLVGYSYQTLLVVSLLLSSLLFVAAFGQP